MKRNFVLFLKDILDAMAKIKEFVGTMDFEEFSSDEMVRSAVVWKLTIIGEAAKNIPAIVRNKYPHIPWSGMAKIRDRLAHGYFTVDYEIVWKVIKEELPELKPKIKEVYENESRRA